MNMYDDYSYSRYDGPTLHLCDECRALMGDVIDAWRSIPTPTPEPDWSRALRWLDSLCGGRPAVLALDGEPLAGPVEVPERLADIAVRLDAVARTFFTPEVGVALERALVRAEERGAAMGRSSDQVALGVVWAVGHANGLLHPLGPVKERELKDHLQVKYGGSASGDGIRRALVGPYDWEQVERPWSYGTWPRSRHLSALGHPDLLTSTTRRQLIEVRDRALVQSQDDPEEAFYRAG